MATPCSTDLIRDALPSPRVIYATQYTNKGTSCLNVRLPSDARSFNSLRDVRNAVRPVFPRRRSSIKTANSRRYW